ncbi:hypothetical protein BDFB_009008 [Asbolus verrucosus]|uniref:Uncharacterized protein n=1 Tax=Asbolus verrucosus TaxID=1661398 RepID=A0A482W4G4_ASBVE|nr:hypothetical protein BDFB_009008 [Asbolus verrucosus]
MAIVFCDGRNGMKRQWERTMTDADEIQDIGGWSRAISLLPRKHVWHTEQVLSEDDGVFSGITLRI